MLSEGTAGAVRMGGGLGSGSLHERWWVGQKACAWLVSNAFLWVLGLRPTNVLQNSCGGLALTRLQLRLSYRPTHGSPQAS